ncbi:CGNR zinc finger protein [Nocardiopsis sp. Huas11]|uniref:CGNR zinc finger domain-containing protein n=1 Tax=Nocardiopsis sp. Huas11 TaxID=2183912 RepID=UPI000EB341C3|nr:CGNR zinc finger domain-containing protein [Nocardiopsis sp. Huas11]RKS08773.1 CGNR zinc finger protein [Nocardiopsis sp. Huas11]
MPPSNAITGRSVRAVAERTADLLNTLARDDVRPGDVVAVLCAHGENDPVVTWHDVESMRVSADLLRGVLAARDVAEAAERINSVLARVARPPRLTDHGGASHWHVHVDSDDEAPLAEWFLTSAAMALALLVTDRQRPPGGSCAARGCDRAFVDAASGSPRLYCSRRCATRERVAAHRAGTKA